MSAMSSPSRSEKTGAVGRVLERTETGAVVQLDDRRVEVPVRLVAGVPLGSWVALQPRLEPFDSLVVLQAAAIEPERWSRIDEPEAEVLLEPGRLAVFRARAQLIARLRSFLTQRDFLEVATPVLHQQAEACQVHQLVTTGAGGARLYLRTDPEEYLKRYLTAGLPRVFEISTNCRGEAVNDTHLQEFTSIEGYARCWSFDRVLTLVEELLRDALVAVRGEATMQFGGRLHDLSRPLEVLEFDDLVAAAADLRPSGYPGEALAAEVRRRFGWNGTGTALDRYRRTWLEWLFEEHAIPSLERAAFVVGFPVELGLSGRRRPHDPATAYRGELYLPGGFELAHFYDNIVDPVELRERYEYRRAHRLASGLSEVDLDEGLQTSALLGMPPMSGYAIGVDRLLMGALGLERISDTLLFPREGFRAANRAAREDSA